MSYDHWKTTNPDDEYLNDEFEYDQEEEEEEELLICEHCNKVIKDGVDFHDVTRNSGPSEHHLYFHIECWKCPKCGMGGPHYCPADIARD